MTKPAQNRDPVLRARHTLFSNRPRRGASAPLRPAGRRVLGVESAKLLAHDLGAAYPLIRSARVPN